MMDLGDLNSNPSSSIPSPTRAQFHFFPDPIISMSPFKGSDRKRASASELTFMHHDVNNGATNDDLFTTYINDVEKLGENDNDDASDGRGGGGRQYGSGYDGVNGEDKWKDGVVDPPVWQRRTRRRRMSYNVTSVEPQPRKAMATHELADLWAVDPKRAKRILANRMSAARSKLRKAQYIQELERKVQTLHAETTSLSAQLQASQSETKTLAAENSELKLLLLRMEDQAGARDALNETLKLEVERLKTATREMDSSKRLNTRMNHSPQSPLSSPGDRLQLLSSPESRRRHQLLPLLVPSSQPCISSHYLSPATPQPLYDFLPSVAIGNLRELKSGSGGSLSKAETSTCASGGESSTNSY